MIESVLSALFLQSKLNLFTFIVKIWGNCFYTTHTFHFERYSNTLQLEGPGITKILVGIERHIPIAHEIWCFEIKSVNIFREMGPKISYPKNIKFWILYKIMNIEHLILIFSNHIVLVVVSKIVEFFWSKIEQKQDFWFLIF